MNETAPAGVRIDTLHTNEKKRFFRAIDKAIRSKQPYFYLERDITYSLTYEQGYLMVSAAEESSLPNASIYPVLTDKFGKADMTYIKKSSLNPRVVIFHMGWSMQEETASHS